MAETSARRNLPFIKKDNMKKINKNNPIYNPNAPRICVDVKKVLEKYPNAKSFELTFLGKVVNKNKP